MHAHIYLYTHIREKEDSGEIAAWLLETIEVMSSKLVLFWSWLHCSEARSHGCCFMGLLLCCRAVGQAYSSEARSHGCCFMGLLLCCRAVGQAYSSEARGHGCCFMGLLLCAAELLAKHIAVKPGAMDAASWDCSYVLQSCKA